MPRACKASPSEAKEFFLLRLENLNLLFFRVGDGARYFFNLFQLSIILSTSLNIFSIFKIHPKE